MDEELQVKDSNGNILENGDDVHLIKDLKVKGTPVKIKSGTKIKGITLTLDPEEVECRVPKIKGITVLRTEFLKKSNLK
jgi:protein PhnA